MKKIFGLFLLILILSVIKIALSIPRNQWPDYLKIPDFIHWYPLDTLTPPIYGNKLVRQDFIPNFDGLCEIGLSFAFEKGPVDILIKLYQGENQEELILKRDFTLTNIQRKEIPRFRFRPIKSSKNKYFSLVVSAPRATVDTNLQLYYSQYTPHISCRGPLYLNNRKITGELFLIINCRYDLDREIFAYARQKIVKDRFFLLGYGAILLGILGTAIFCTVSFKSPRIEIKS